MTAQVVTLATALITELATAGKTATRRYVPFFEANEVADGKWFVMAATEEVQKKRAIDLETHAVDVAYQRALPGSQAGAENPLENNTFLDACMAEVETVKALFREGGSLSAKDIGSKKWVVVRMSNSPIYRPDLLLENQIFTSVIRLEFLAQE